MGGSKLPSHPRTNPSNAKKKTKKNKKKKKSLFCDPLLVRTAICFFQVVCCNLKEDREKREIGTSNIEINCG